MATRERLGRRAAFSHREYVYRAADSFEVDEVEGYEVTRKRVFFDEVLLVTIHSFVPWGNVVAAGLLGALLVLLSYTLWTLSRGWAFAMLALAAAFAVYLVLLLSMGAEAVMIQGRRTQARMHFGLRKARARAVFQLAGRLVRERQQRVARATAPRAPARSGQVGEPPPPA